jgi:hypothetical protein
MEPMLREASQAPLLKVHESISLISPLNLLVPEVKE